MSKLRNFLARGVVSLVNSALKNQMLQIKLTAGEVKDSVEHFETYGLTSHPLVGAEVLTGFIGGDRSHAIALVVSDRRYRPQGLLAGEVCLYTHEGDEIRLQNGRVIKVTAGSKVEVVAPVAKFICSAMVEMETPKLKVSGDIESGGDISDSRGSMSAMRGTYNEHKHPRDGVPDKQMG
ncbi:MAG: phage baseplate assembly protein V [Paenalcaligenes sp.]